MKVQKIKIDKSLDGICHGKLVELMENLFAQDFELTTNDDYNIIMSKDKDEIKIDRR